MYVRPWSVEDAAVLSAAWNDPTISRWNPVPPDTSESFARSWISGTSSQNEASIGVDVVLSACESGPSSAVLGEIGLQIDPANAIAEVGFWVSDGERRSGNGRRLLEYAYELAQLLELRGLVAMTDAHNMPAIALLERSGWSEVASRSERRAFAKRVVLP